MLLVSWRNCFHWGWLKWRGNSLFGRPPYRKSSQFRIFPRFAFTSDDVGPATEPCMGFHRVFIHRCTEVKGAGNLSPNQQPHGAKRTRKADVLPRQVTGGRGHRPSDFGDQRFLPLTETSFCFSVDGLKFIEVAMHRTKPDSYAIAQQRRRGFEEQAASRFWEGAEVAPGGKHSTQEHHTSAIANVSLRRTQRFSGGTPFGRSVEAGLLGRQ